MPLSIKSIFADLHIFLSDDLLILPCYIAFIVSRYITRDCNFSIISEKVFRSRQLIFQLTLDIYLKLGRSSQYGELCDLEFLQGYKVLYNSYFSSRKILHIDIIIIVIYSYIANFADKSQSVICFTILSPIIFIFFFVSPFLLTFFLTVLSFGITIPSS